MRLLLTDSGPAYRSANFDRLCSDLGVRRRFTRPYRPQTNGKVERFNRALREEWAYVRTYRSEPESTRALDSGSTDTTITELCEARLPSDRGRRRSAL